MPRDGDGSITGWIAGVKADDLAAAQPLRERYFAQAALAVALRWRAARPDLRPDRAAAFDRLLREAESVPEGPLPDRPADVFGQ